jgi:hypothetical protein
MIYTVYGYKVPNYVFFTFINDICKKYNFLEQNDNDTEQIEDAKLFLKLNLRYCIEKCDIDNTTISLINYRITIATELCESIEKLDIIKQYLEIRKKDIVKSILDKNILHDDITKYVLMEYTTLNYINSIRFKSIDIYKPDYQNPNYEIITGICLNEIDTNNYPYNILIDDESLVNNKDVLIELFENEFKDYKLSLVITKYDNFFE